MPETALHHCFHFLLPWQEMIPVTSNKYIFWNKVVEMGKRHLLHGAGKQLLSWSSATLQFLFWALILTSFFFFFLVLTIWLRTSFLKHKDWSPRCSQCRETHTPGHCFLVHQLVYLWHTVTCLLSTLPFFLLIDARSRSDPSKSSWNRFAFTSENHSPVTNFFFFSSLMEPCILLQANENITLRRSPMFQLSLSSFITAICTILLSATTKDPEVIPCNRKGQTSIKVKADLFYFWRRNRAL